MKMSQHIPKWVTLSSLRERGGMYTGIVADVVEEQLNNVHRGCKTMEPVIVFADGTRLCPNISMRRNLQRELGDETTAWCGRTLVVRIEPRGKGEQKVVDVAQAANMVALTDEEIPF